MQFTKSVFRPVLLLGVSLAICAYGVWLTVSWPHPGDPNIGAGLISLGGGMIMVTAMIWLISLAKTTVTRRLLVGLTGLMIILLQGWPIILHLVGR